MALKTVEERTAFCATCPMLEDVTSMLNSLAFALDFTMEAQDDQVYLHLLPLPAQCHYEGPGGVRGTPCRADGVHAS